MADKVQQKDLVPILRSLLLKYTARTQQELCVLLKKYGYQVNQTRISRLLRKLGAVKTLNERGKVVYWLAKDPPPPNLASAVSTMIINVTANENMIVIYTTPGAASVISRIIDHISIKHRILGTIAGDDTLFVVPKSIKRIQEIYQILRVHLGFATANSSKSSFDL